MSLAYRRVGPHSASVPRRSWPGLRRPRWLSQAPNPDAALTWVCHILARTFTLIVARQVGRCGGRYGYAGSGLGYPRSDGRGPHDYARGMVR
jgi:hypothetical protein